MTAYTYTRADLTPYHRARAILCSDRPDERGRPRPRLYTLGAAVDALAEVYRTEPARRDEAARHALGLCHVAILGSAYDGELSDRLGAAWSYLGWPTGEIDTATEADRARRRRIDLRRCHRTERGHFASDCWICDCATCKTADEPINAASDVDVLHPEAA